MNLDEARAERIELQDRLAELGRMQDTINAEVPVIRDRMAWLNGFCEASEASD